MKVFRIFDDIDKEFERIHDEWNDIEKKFQKMKQDSSLKDNYHFSSHYENFYDSNQKDKSYSLSYKYETGMDEPEIMIEGDVDKDTINRFVSGINSKYGVELEGSSIKNPKLLLSKKKKKNEKKGEPKDDTHIYRFEMPGIGLKDIETKIEGDLLKIIGKNDKVEYKKQIRLPFKPKNKPTIDADNGLITLKVNK
ncbi:hypothetical protein NEF87_000261 [Candidatus Lokiarchaeum ossiferum]|uniref:SHSP domain-containing protein n=1 Tax=Candidatus Lokiarchaeum ossiferum TaxID=2951803 RepID=A0ABY6HKC3_9ARCH|nr:hypothetical protein NEF87_000261 [Candidatus Lokiarchaeum sp. B-35]